MFRISIIELALVCLLFLLVLIGPLLWKGFSARINRRIDALEKKIDKGK